MRFGCVCEECLTAFTTERWLGPFWCDACQRGAPDFYRAISGHHKVWVYADGPKPYRGRLVRTPEQIMGRAS